VIQIPIDDFASQIVGSPEAACSSLELFRHWGLNRFSVSWLTADARKVLRQLRLWGMEVNIYNVPDLPAFLQAVTLLPKSVTADFNFPEWHYFGRGSGRNHDYNRYQMSHRADLS